MPGWPARTELQHLLAGAVWDADAVGDDIIRRTPVQPEQIVAALANGRKPVGNPLQAFI